MANFSINKLSEEDIKRAYRFIYIFEKEVSNKFGTFDFENEEIEQFCNEHRIFKKTRRDTKPTDNYFWFNAKKPKNVRDNDIAHNLLRRIRNAMAHGNFKKERSKKAFYVLEDFDKNNKKTMYGRINADIFWDYLNIVLHSSPLIDDRINLNR